MFTGIIEGLGTVSAASASGAGKRLSVQADFDLTGSRVGDSFAVNGACLTAVSLDRRCFAVDVSPESLKRTTLGSLGVGRHVNLERALRLSDRLDGHLVSGHIDGVGTVKTRLKEGNSLVIGIAVSPSLSRYMIEKGSVAVDGISLTVNTVGRDNFSVSIIPHTAEMTTLRSKTVGDAVNIETDMIGKYVERFLTAGRSNGAGSGSDHPVIDREFLHKTGFI